MDLATFNHYRLTGDTRTTQALNALYRARPASVVAALRTARPFTGLPDPFLTALRQRRLNPLDIDHIREWPDKDKERIREAVLNAISSDQTVRFAWKLHDGNRERTIIRPAGPGAITITFFSPWNNVRVVGEDEIIVDVSPGG